MRIMLFILMSSGCFFGCKSNHGSSSVKDINFQQNIDADSSSELYVHLYPTNDGKNICMALCDKPFTANGDNVNRPTSTEDSLAGLCTVIGKERPAFESYVKDHFDSKTASDIIEYVTTRKANPFTAENEAQYLNLAKLTEAAMPDTKPQRNALGGTSGPSADEIETTLSKIMTMCISDFVAPDKSVIGKTRQTYWKASCSVDFNYVDNSDGAIGIYGKPIRKSNSAKAVAIGFSPLAAKDIATNKIWEDLSTFASRYGLRSFTDKAGGPLAYESIKCDQAIPSDTPPPSSN